MKLDIAVMADAANVTREGKLNICGIFRNIYGQQLPMVWPSMTMALQVTMDAGEKGKAHALGVSFIDPKGKTVQKFPDMQFGIPVDVPGTIIGLPLTIGLANTVFEMLGVYRYELSLNGTVASTVTIEIMPPPPTAPLAQAG